MTTPTALGRMNKYTWGFYVWIGILGVLVVLGLYNFVRQTVEGHHVTGLSNAVLWGLYITGFVFFVGTSAGATVIGLMIHAFGREDYAPLGTRAILVGMLSLMAAILFITVDVGSIPRMLRLPIIWRNPTSTFMYTSITYYVFGLLMAAELFYTLKVTRGVATLRDKKIGKWLAIAAVPFALVVVHAPHGGLFAVIKARDFWNTLLLPPHFAIAAVATGTAVMMLVAIVTSAWNKRELVSRRTLAHMGALLTLFIGVAAFLDVFDLLVFTYSDKPAGNAAWDVLFGQNLPITIIHVGGYFVAFVILLYNRGRSIPLLGVGAGIAIIALAAFRYNLTSVGLGTPLLPFESIASYTQTWGEILLALGIVGLIPLIYTVLTRVIPMEERVGRSS